MSNFWNTLSRPIMVLAPLAGVTDAAFRRIIAKYGKPDVMWTEFVSADGLYHTRELQKRPDADNPLMRDLVYDESERPIVAQLFSADPAMIKYGARVVMELGFDGVDINMGCPDRSVEKQGAGAALMKNPKRARELIKAAKQGVDDMLPVSVKTRIGYNKNELTTWLPELLEEEPAALTIHVRTRKEMSLVPARWEHAKEAVKLRNDISPRTLIIGNGDVQNMQDARVKAKESGVDGVMIGRGIFGNPWLWSEQTPAHDKKLAVLVEHCKMFEDLCSHNNFAIMKKHFKAYVHGFAGAHDLRAKLMACNSAKEVERVITDTKLYEG